MSKDLAVFLAAANKAASALELMQFTADELIRQCSTYDWAGFYLLEEGGPEPMLVLGPFHGAETPHKRIPLYRGICGAAASCGETIIVDNVAEDPRYFSCSQLTRSEIVVPFRVHGKVAGELDIDSDTLNAFTEEDRIFCEKVAALAGLALEKERP
jgi:GAF domain-containing protein